jgi:small-conductance mechanosensitive channel
MTRAYWLFLITLFAVASAFTHGHRAYAAPPPSDYAAAITNWTKQQAHIDRKLKTDARLDETQISVFRQQMRDIVQAADSEVARIKEQLASQKELLDALGPAPENKTNEAKKLRQKREELTATLNAIDAELKQRNLIIATSEELLMALDDYQKKRVKELLFARAIMPFSYEGLRLVSSEFFSSIQAFHAWHALWVVLLGIGVIIACSGYITRKLNRFSAAAANIHVITPFSAKRLAMVAVAALCVFLLRFNIISIADYPALENMLHALASVSLSVILFIALGKITFISVETENDSLGERRKDYSWLWNTIKRMVRGILFLLPIVAFVGYINVALYLSFNILITIVGTLLFFGLRSLMVAISARLAAEKTKNELSPIAITFVEPILAIFCCLLVLFFWGMTSEDLQTFAAKYRDGITVGEVTIEFSSIIYALGFFFALYYLTRIVQWFLVSRVFPYTKLDTGVRHAVIAVTGYVGVISALLVSMGMLGLNMSNLAIVAGALSVGIGFGLQAIFNNFVSGLILLFERPVKVGDWVVVGDKQGTIKKIRVRSTEIETFWNSSVIVPNSQLISETVTNWTLHDRVGRVDVGVGVAYGTDTEKVKRVLLDVAKNHPQVRALPEARVFFMNFGDSSLDFELRCFIRNIRDVFVVSSDLRFAIDRAFREHGIQIPFPQRDVHIKSSGGDA